ncbi:hypothetical protein [Terriglobus sp.]|uniref:hypothetical protein n=1 Tax=Terriglobus sp. TaxID=1889013 RepID=UPI003B00F486
MLGLFLCNPLANTNRFGQQRAIGLGQLFQRAKHFIGAYRFQRGVQASKIVHGQAEPLLLFAAHTRHQQVQRVPEHYIRFEAEFFSRHAVVIIAQLEQRDAKYRMNG